ncbi:MAG: hypothetical protein RLZZ618_3904 [Pseudomonadota bacterium]|jgi:hypothetical protein
MKHALVALSLAGGLISAAQAGEVYGGIGLPGAMLGYAHSVSPSLTVRGDFATLGSRKERTTEEGVTYDSNIGFNRAGLFADWFPAGNGFRVVGGLTFNNLKADLSARGDGVTQFTIGSQTFTSNPNDRMDVSITYPKVTPYLGLGYGHHADKGWGFVFDLGASFGRAKVSETHSGPSFSSSGGPVTQADVDAETQELRDGVAKVTFIPQVSLGVSYKF